MSKVYLHFTDKDGDAIILPNDIVAIWTTADKSEIRSFYGQTVVASETAPMRIVRSMRGGEFEVAEATEEILARIQAATAKQELEELNARNRD